LVGTWTNVVDDGNIAQIIITDNDGSLQANAFGFCSPTFCNLGVANAFGFSANISSATAIGFESVNTNAGFETLYQQGHLVTNKAGKTYLQVTSGTTFNDVGDTRFDYSVTENFVKK